MNYIAELNKPSEGFTVTVAPGNGPGYTFYDALYITHDRGRGFGKPSRIQCFLDSNHHGATVVCQVRFLHVIIDVLFDVALPAHRATLDALSKQPTLPVYQYTTIEGGGRELVNSAYIPQAVLVRRGIQECLKQAVGHNRTLGDVSWPHLVEVYRKESGDVLHGAV